MTDDERRIRELVELWIAASKAGDIPSLLPADDRRRDFHDARPPAIRESRVRRRRGERQKE